MHDAIAFHSRRKRLQNLSVDGATHFAFARIGGLPTVGSSRLRTTESSQIPSRLTCILCSKNSPVEEPSLGNIHLGRRQQNQEMQVEQVLSNERNIRVGSYSSARAKIGAIKL